MYYNLVIQCFFMSETLCQIVVASLYQPVVSVSKVGLFVRMMYKFIYI